MGELDSLGLPSGLLVWLAARSSSCGSDTDYLFRLSNFGEVYTRLRDDKDESGPYMRLYGCRPLS